MRRTAFLVASLVVSAGFLWLALRDVPFADVVETIRTANIGWIIFSFLSVIVAVWARAIRWRGLVGNKIPLRRAFYILSITFLLNQLPLRAGEVARGLLATRSGVPFVTAATSIVLERLLDTLLVVVLLAVGLSRLPTALPSATQVATLFGVTAVVAFGVLVVLARYPQIAHRILDALEQRLVLTRRLPLRGMLDNVLAGLAPLTQWRSAAHAIGWTLISWAISLVTFYTLILAFGITDIDGWLMTLLAVSLASFSIAIPVSVAAIGPFELAVKLAGQGVGLSDLLSTSLGFLFHWLTILSYAVIGTVGMLALGVSLGEMVGGRPKPSPASESADPSVGLEG